MTSVMSVLASNQQRGSKPRCHWITDGTPADVADRLTKLVHPWGLVTANDRWMPQGFVDLEEAQLHRAPRLLDVIPHGQALERWWLAVRGARSKTPNFDIASTCQVPGPEGLQQGLLLVEAKAHVQELDKECAGKLLAATASANSTKNHEQIANCIASAGQLLNLATSLPWSITSSTHYQMANRFAWARKLAELGFPVILVYLGFIEAAEMVDVSPAFCDPADWRARVEAHGGAGGVPPAAWNRPHTVGGQPFVPLIRSVQIPHDRPIQRFIVT